MNVVVMFPYPSGAGLHLGHYYNYALMDSQEEGSQEEERGGGNFCCPRPSNNVWRDARMFERGDRIELVHMGDDESDPIEDGATGTVYDCWPALFRTPEGVIQVYQVDVEWDNGRVLMLVLPFDKAKKVGKNDAGRHLRSDHGGKIPRLRAWGHRIKTTIISLLADRQLLLPQCGR